MTNDHLCATGPPRSSKSPSRLSKAASDSGPAGPKCSAGLLVSDVALPGLAQIAAVAGVVTSISRALFAVILGVFPNLPSAGPAGIIR